MDYEEYYFSDIASMAELVIETLELPWHHLFQKNVPPRQQLIVSRLEKKLKPWLGLPHLHLRRSLFQQNRVFIFDRDIAALSRSSSLISLLDVSVAI